MRRLGPPALLIGVGLVVLADFLVVNPTLGSIAGLILDLVVFVAAAAALAGVLALAVRHGGDLFLRRADAPASVALLGGLVAMVVAGVRPGSTGASDPATQWLVAALLVPLGATLFGLLFISTLGAVRRAVASRRPDAALLAVAAGVVLIVLLPASGALGEVLSSAAAWTVAIPIGATFRGLLIGIGLVTAVTAARTLLGIGPGSE